MSPSDPVVRVLFVCTGNTCRSPLAAAALVHELGTDASRVQIGSAGTSAWEGQPASEGSVRVAEADGIDLASHRSKRVSVTEIRAADWVFVMEPMHRIALEAVGGPRDRVHVISEWPAGGEPDLEVSDPFGGSIEAYEECWRRIRRHVQRIAPHVRQALRERMAS